jgi:hypothetical protein
MAVLWRSNENTDSPDARYREDSDPSPAVPGVAGQKNTFLEKHLRIRDPLPSEEDMKKIVKKVYDDRQKNKNSPVQSVTGPSDKTKQQLYGGIKPPANSTYFIGLAGFQETNAWIEKNVTTSNKHAEVPILGDGVVVTYDDATKTYVTTKAGKIKLSIAVGNTTDFEGSRGQTLSMESKIVYHWGGVV